MSSSTENKYPWQSEVAILLAVILGVAMVAAFFYWWGSQSDRAFGERKAEMLLNQLANLEDDSQRESGMELFVSFSKVADTTERLLECPLDEKTWLDIARKHAYVQCQLVSMGSLERGDEFCKWCDQLVDHSDAEIRELANAASHSYAFEKQLVCCRHKILVDQLVARANEEVNGSVGQQFANRIETHQQANWRLEPIIGDLQGMVKDLPQGNSLASRIDTYCGRLLDLEDMAGDAESDQPFARWLEDAQRLIEEYPNNKLLCQGLIRQYDRLVEVGSYDEAGQMLEIITAGYKDHADAEIQAHYQQMLDRKLAAELQLPYWQVEIERDPAAADKMVAALRESLPAARERNELSEGFVERLLDIAQSVENAQQYDRLAELRDLYQNLLGAHGQFADRVQQWCSDCAKRVGMVGKPFLLPASRMEASPVSLESLKSKATAVIFWAAKDKESLPTLQRIEQLYFRNSDSNFAMIGINVDRDLELVRTLMSQGQLQWPILVAAELDAAGNNSVAAEYGIERTPYIILVGPDGNVVDVALNVGTMWNKVTEVLPELKPKPRSRRAGPAR